MFAQTLVSAARSLRTASVGLAGFVGELSRRRSTPSWRSAVIYTRPGRRLLPVRPALRRRRHDRRQRQRLIHEDHLDRDAAHRRVRQRAVGARPHRRRDRRPRRDLLRRRRGRGAYPRHARGAAARQQPAAHRGAAPGDDQPADGAGLDRRRISRRLGHRHRAMGPVRQGLRPAGAPDARRALPRQAAHLQHLRRLQICPLAEHQAGVELECSAKPADPTRISTAS